MVDLPVSLTPAAPPTMVASARGLADTPSSPTSVGYFLLYTYISVSKLFTSIIPLYSTIADALIVQNHLKPSADLVKGLSITITPAMLDQMKAALPAELGTLALPPPGPMPFRDFVFNFSDNGNFVYSLTIPEATGATTIYWNADKSKFGMKSTMTVPSYGTTPAYTSTFTIANDEATQSSYVRNEAQGHDWVMKFKADPSATATRGVYVSIVNSDLGAYPSSSTLLGYGDDFGGALDDTWTRESTTSLYHEVFNAKGQVTYQTHIYGGTGIPLTSTFGTPSTAYDTKLANTDWGKASSLF